MAQTYGNVPDEDAQDQGTRRVDASRGNAQRPGVPGAGESLAQRGEQEAREAVDKVVAEEYPRRTALTRGRVWLAVYCVVVLIFAAMALAAHFLSFFPGDVAFTRKLQDVQIPGFGGLMSFITYLGNPSQSAILLVVAVAVLLVMRMPLEALFLLLTLLADALGAIIKSVVGRMRPSPSLVDVTQPNNTPSFPSGHTLHDTVFYGFLIFIVATKFKPSLVRNVVIALLAIPIALIGLSRVYLGEHWASDVVGGYIIGALCLVPLIAAYLWVDARFELVLHPPFLQRRPPTLATPSETKPPQ